MAQLQVSNLICTVTAGHFALVSKTQQEEHTAQKTNAIDKTLLHHIIWQEET
jgi:hypothetical protein